MEITNFEKWLELATDLAEKSIKNYVGAISKINSQLVELNIVQISIEEVKVQDVAKKFGTPAYYYSYGQLKENIQNLKKSFSSFAPLICFAIKSNTNVNLISQIKKFG